MLIFRVTRCKREFGLRALQQKVDPNNQFCWPTYFADEGESSSQGDKVFPLLPDNQYIGIIHADGNGLGAIVKNAMQNICLGK